VSSPGGPITGDPEARRHPPQVSTRRIKLPPNPKDVESALRFASWIVVQVARKNISAPEAKAMLDGLREFRALLDARDADKKLAEAKKVLEEMKALRSKP
jgi:hypothetical protein